MSPVRVRTKTAYCHSADPRCGPCRMHGGSSGLYATSHLVRHTTLFGRRAGYTVGVTETGQTGAWTTAQDGDPPVGVPVPAGATG